MFKNWFVFPYCRRSHNRLSLVNERLSHPFFCMVSMMESMLEAELSKLGVGVEEFVQRLQSSRSKACQAAGELVDAVLAMDDFNEFKRMMLQLKGDLDLANLPQDTLDQFASGSLAVTHTI